MKQTLRIATTVFLATALAVALKPLLANGLTSSRSSAAKLLNVAQNVVGPGRGMDVVISLISPIDVRRLGVITDGAGDVAFRLHVVNTGTRNFDCEAVRAKTISTRQPTPFNPPVASICPGNGNTIAPKHAYNLSFFAHSNPAGITTRLIVYPFGPDANRAVWIMPPGYGACSARSCSPPPTS